MAEARRAWWPRVLVIGLLLAVAGYVATRLEWVERSERTGLSGEALKNPYHAGMLLLGELGLTSRKLDSPEVRALPQDATLLLAYPMAVGDRRQREQLLAWVKGGGHLVLPLSRGMETAALLDELGVRVRGWHESDARSQGVLVEDDMLQADLRDALVFDLDDRPEWAAILVGRFDEEEDEDSGDNEQRLHAFHTADAGRLAAHERQRINVFARFPYGRGRVTVGDFGLFTNRFIGSNDHARIFVRVMTLPEGARPALLMLEPDFPSLPGWLAQRAPEALWALGALLVAILWRAMPRFGPLLPVLPPVRPGLLEHLRAVGDFLLREKQYEALISPLREEVRRALMHLRSRHPEIDSLPALGAQLSGLDERDIDRALTANPDDAHEFLRRCRTLSALRAHCLRLRSTSYGTGTSS